jgi:hypothetical protein
MFIYKSYSCFNITIHVRGVKKIIKEKKSICVRDLQLLFFASTFFSIILDIYILVYMKVELSLIFVFDFFFLFQSCIFTRNIYSI